MQQAFEMRGGLPLGTGLERGRGGGGGLPPGFCHSLKRKILKQEQAGLVEARGESQALDLEEKVQAAGELPAKLPLQVITFCSWSPW